VRAFRCAFVPDTSGRPRDRESRSRRPAREGIRCQPDPLVNASICAAVPWRTAGKRFPSPLATQIRSAPAAASPSSSVRRSLIPAETHSSRPASSRCSCSSDLAFSSNTTSQAARSLASPSQRPLPHRPLPSRIIPPNPRVRRASPLPAVPHNRRARPASPLPTDPQNPRVRRAAPLPTIPQNARASSATDWPEASPRRRRRDTALPFPSTRHRCTPTSGARPTSSTSHFTSAAAATASTTRRTPTSAA